MKTTAMIALYHHHSTRQDVAQFYGVPTQISAIQLSEQARMLPYKANFMQPMVPHLDKSLLRTANMVF